MLYTPYLHEAASFVSNDYTPPKRDCYYLSTPHMLYLCHCGTCSKKEYIDGNGAHRKGQWVANSTRRSHNQREMKRKREVEEASEVDERKAKKAYIDPAAKVDLYQSTSS